VVVAFIVKTVAGMMELCVDDELGIYELWQALAKILRIALGIDQS
jgi:hypothetical protein